MSKPGTGPTANKHVIRVFLVASTADELVEKQIMNNAGFGKQFDYGDPMVGPDKKWYVWYNRDLTNEIRSFNINKARETKTVELP